MLRGDAQGFMCFPLVAGTFRVSEDFSSLRLVRGLVGPMIGLRALVLGPEFETRLGGFWRIWFQGDYATVVAREICWRDYSSDVF